MQRVKGIIMGRLDDVFLTRLENAYKIYEEICSYQIKIADIESHWISLEDIEVSDSIIKRYQEYAGITNYDVKNYFKDMINFVNETGLISGDKKYEVKLKRLILLKKEISSLSGIYERNKCEYFILKIKLQNKRWELEKIFDDLDIELNELKEKMYNGNDNDE